MELPCPTEFSHRAAPSAVFGFDAPLMSFGRRRLDSRVFGTQGSGAHQSSHRILSWACALLQSATSRKAARSALHASRRQTFLSIPPMGFRPLRRVPAQGSGLVARMLPRVRAPAPPGFLDLLALSIRPEPAGLVSCQIRPWGFSSSELCSFRAARLPSPTAAPLMPLPEPPVVQRKTSPRAQTAANTSMRRPRLQGLHPRESPTLWADGLGRIRARSSPEVSPLQGVPPHCLGSDSRLCLPSCSWRMARRIGQPAPASGFHSAARLACLRGDCRPS
jgi:hypothetical protein